MTAPEFGDLVPEDVFAAEGDPDPEQVARRLHEMRSAMRVLAGGLPLPPWHLYDRAALETAAIATAVESLTLANAPDFGRALHEARRSIDHLPAWDDLTAEERELTVAIGVALVVWLLDEGTLR